MDWRCGDRVHSCAFFKLLKCKIPRHCIRLGKLAAVLACVAAWMYTVDARTRGAVTSTNLSRFLAARFDGAAKTEVLVAEHSAAHAFRQQT